MSVFAETGPCLPDFKAPLPELKPGSGFSRANEIWSKAEFAWLCQIMLNGNGKSEFLLAYQDNSGVTCFCRAKSAKVAQRVDWAWSSIAGAPSQKTGIGFYPSNQQGQSRWGAMDFDAHDGDSLRARGLAFAAHDALAAQLDYQLILTTSGSDGWHLFVFQRNFRDCRDWVSLLRRVAGHIGTEIRPGVCEIFPAQHVEGSLGRGIRAPGTWNPKSGRPGLIAFHSMGPLLSKR
jgi:hypothetical protein